MALKHSDYIRDGLTARIRGNCGGAYGGDVDYDYGMFYKGESAIRITPTPNLRKTPMNATASVRCAPSASVLCRSANTARI